MVEKGGYGRLFIFSTPPPQGKVTASQRLRSRADMLCDRPKG
jgi:hypothetical protein